MKNTVMYLLEEDVRRFPEKTALADEFRAFSYREYLALAVRLAEEIRARTACAEPAAAESWQAAPVSRPVGVLIDRNALSVAAFLGIAYSGNFYVPLDPSLPEGRLSVILRELSPALLIDAREKAQASRGKGTGSAGDPDAGTGLPDVSAGLPGERAGEAGGMAAEEPRFLGVPVLDIHGLLADAAGGMGTPASAAGAGTAPAAPDRGVPCVKEDGRFPGNGEGNAPEEGTATGESSPPGESIATGDGDAALLARAAQLRGGILDTDPLYAIFTSGSTGVPKGVLVPHRSVLDLVEAFGEVFGFAPDAVFGNQAPFDFDVSVKDIYNALHCGGRLEVVPRRMFVMPALLMEHLASRGINTIIWAVSALRIVSDLRALDSMETSVPVRLRHVMFSGEVMPVKSVNYWIRFFPEAVFVNLYGPTEITCNCTYHILDRPYGTDEVLPIGRPFPNTRVFLLEAEEPGQDGDAYAGEEAGWHEPSHAGKGSNAYAGAEHASSRGERAPRLVTPARPGVRGEICVEGTGVALGYWNDPVRTDAAFTRRPGVPATLNRIYRTGDLGYYNSRGELFFAARADNQIKHMGHRIELGEIEAALAGISCIDTACCFYDEKKEKIICIYQAREEQRRAIIAALSDRLPKYMRPNRYIRMEQLPLNAHAKIDRRLLRSLYDDKKLG